MLAATSAIAPATSTMPRASSPTTPTPANGFAHKTPTYEIGIVMGKSGCGKTSLVESIVLPYARSGGRVWVVDPNHAWDGVEDVRQVFSIDGEWEEVLAALENTPPGVVVFDDADLYLRYAPRFARVWMTSHRHLRKHVILVARRPAGMTEILGNADWFALFAMREENAVEKWRSTLGDEVADMIPREPYSYCYVRDPHPPELRQTPRRLALHKSEIQ